MTSSVSSANRRVVLGVVALVIGGILISAASIGISYQLDKQARSQGECRTDARNIEFDGLKTEMGATTALLEFAINNPDRTRAELRDAITDYQTALETARTAYRTAEREFAAC